MLLFFIEPTSLKPQLDTNSSAQVSKSREGERRGEDSRALTVSSSRSDRTEARVSSSASDNQSRYVFLFIRCFQVQVRSISYDWNSLPLNFKMEGPPIFCLLMLLILLQHE